MSDRTEPTESTESTDATDNAEHVDLDVKAEQEKLDKLHDRIEDTRHHADDDLMPGGAGRTFTDEGVRAQVQRGGDTHPNAGF